MTAMRYHPLGVLLIIVSAAGATILSGCSMACAMDGGAGDTSVPRSGKQGAVGDPEHVMSVWQYNRHMAVVDAENLQHFNIGDEAGLRSDLQTEIALDVQELWIGVQSKEISVEERERTYDTLRLIAVESEKYPVPAWNADNNLQAIFKAALEDDPVKTAEMRSRNWSNNWWVKSPR